MRIELKCALILLQRRKYALDFAKFEKARPHPQERVDQR